MKQLASSYTINGSAVTLTGVNVPLSQILLVSDATTGNVLYSMAGPSATSYTQAANSVITLATAPGASDKLTIYYDDGVALTNGQTSVSVSNFPSSTEISNDVGNPIPVSASALPLPSGAATAANQSTEITALGHLTDGTQTTKIVNGANTLAIDSLGAATVNNAPSLVQTYNSTGAVSLNTIAIGPTNIAAYRQISVQCASIGNGNFAFEVSNDNTNWVALQLGRSDGGTAYNPQIGLYTTGSYVGPTFGYNYFRLRVSGASTTGTNTIAVSFSGNPVSGSWVNIVASGNTIGNVNIVASTGSTPSTFTATTSTQILASNTSRKGVVLSSPSTNTGICYVVIGTTTASSTAFSFLVNPGDILSLAGINNALTGIWSASSNTLYVTELT
jgi:hypothetical protein